MPEQIVVNISPDGEIDYKVQGILGAKCKDITKLIDTLGKVTESKTTAEFCAIDTQQQQRTGR